MRGGCRQITRFGAADQPGENLCRTLETGALHMDRSGNKRPGSGEGLGSPESPKARPRPASDPVAFHLHKSTPNASTLYLSPQITPAASRRGQQLTARDGRRPEGRAEAVRSAQSALLRGEPACLALGSAQTHACCTGARASSSDGEEQARHTARAFACASCPATDCWHAPSQAAYEKKKYDEAKKVLEQLKVQLLCRTGPELVAPSPGGLSARDQSHNDCMKMKEVLVR
jgi:hypothetical protein